MAMIDISLPDEMTAFVEAQMAREGHESASEYILALIREAWKRQAKQELEAKLLEGLESGPEVEMVRGLGVLASRGAGGPSRRGHTAVTKIVLPLGDS